MECIFTILEFDIWKDSTAPTSLELVVENLRNQPTCPPILHQWLYRYIQSSPLLQHTPTQVTVDHGHENLEKHRSRDCFFQDRMLAYVIDK